MVLGSRKASTKCSRGFRPASADGQASLQRPHSMHAAGSNRVWETEVGDPVWHPNANELLLEVFFGSVFVPHVQIATCDGTIAWQFHHVLEDHVDRPHDEVKVFSVGDERWEGAENEEVNPPVDRGLGASCDAPVKSKSFHFENVGEHQPADHGENNAGLQHVGESVSHHRVASDGQSHDAGQNKDYKTIENGVKRSERDGVL